MLRAEILALTSTTATKVATAVAVLGLLLTQLAFVTLLPALARGDIGPGAEALGDDLTAVDLSRPDVQVDALSPLGASMGGGSLGIVVLALALLGVVAGTSDFRFGGIVGAALAAPRRHRIMGAKVAAAGATGLVLGAVLAGLSAATLLVTLAASGTDLAVDPLTVVGVVGRAAPVVACLVVIGLSVGVIARNQLAGVLVMLAVLVGEPLVAGTAQLVTGTMPSWVHALPLALVHSALGASPGPWGPWLSLAALVGVTGVAAVGAAVALGRRDL